VCAFCTERKKTVSKYEKNMPVNLIFPSSPHFPVFQLNFSPYCIAIWLIVHMYSLNFVHSFSCCFFLIHCKLFLLHSCFNSMKLTFIILCYLNTDAVKHFKNLKNLYIARDTIQTLFELHNLVTSISTRFCSQTWQSSILQHGRGLNETHSTQTPRFLIPVKGLM
jgi:hypothetical protein